MKKHVITAVLLCIAVVPQLAAQAPCPGPNPQISGKLKSPQGYTISWPSVPGAVTYFIEETRSGTPQNMRTSRLLYTNNTSIDIQHESINDVTYSYTITAYTNAEPCTMHARAVTFADPELRRAVRRGIVPVVGSTRGANGALFKTYLRLEGANTRGKVIFHQAGRQASDNDPSIAYDLTHAEEIVWDDIVATLGQSGIGSLSIVPDEGLAQELPRATVRLYNVADNGIYGTSAEMYPGIDFLDVDSPFQRIDVPVDGNFRVNVGVRAVLQGTARAIAVGVDGLQKGTAERHFLAGEMVMGSPEAVYGLSLAPGEVLLVSFSRAMIPFYTLTDNRTNDPFLYVQGVERDSSVEEYVK